MITKGFTPATFNVTMGQKYTITATDSGDDYFNHWTNGFTVRVMPVHDKRGQHHVHGGVCELHPAAPDDHALQHNDQQSRPQWRPR